MSRVYADGDLTGIDRHPDFLPLFEGTWDWYRYSDGTSSSRWLADRPYVAGVGYPEVTTFRCTHCGRETPNFYVIRRHNGLISQRRVA